MTHPVDEAYLAHYGVLGMKWGVRKDKKSGFMANRRAKSKARDKERASNTAKARKAGFNPTTSQRADFGARGIRNIEKRIAEGDSPRKAVALETTKQTAQGLLVTGILSAAYIGATIVAPNMARSAAVKRGEKAAADLFANNKGITSYQTVALKFDDFAGVWR